MPLAIDLQGIHKTFHPRKQPSVHAVRGTNLRVEEGDAVALTGHNGAGKTTLLKICSTVIIPDEGGGEVCGIPLRRHHEIRKHIGLLAADERSFYWRLTGRQNLHFFGSLQNLSAREINQRIDSLAEVFEIDYLDRRFDQCSTGMKQHIGLLRTLLHEPKLLLLDEPTRSIDIEATERFRAAMHRLIREQGRTLLLVTHNHTLAHTLCRRVLTVESGQIVDERTAAELGTADAPRFRIVTDTLAAMEARLLESTFEIESVELQPKRGRAILTTIPRPGALSAPCNVSASCT